MNNDEIRKLLDDEIEAQIEALKDLTFGTEGRSAVLEELRRLHGLRIDEIKAEAEYKDKCEGRENDEHLRRLQLEEQKRDRYFRLAAAGAELIIPLIFYGVWMRRGFRFEEKGSITSTTFKDLIRHFRPAKK